MSETSLSEFIGSTLVSHDIERNGKTKTFWFAEISQEKFEEIFAGVNDKDPKSKRGVDAKVILAVVRDADNKPMFTKDEAANLPRTLSQQLAKQALKVNGFGSKEDEAEAKNE